MSNSGDSSNSTDNNNSAETTTTATNTKKQTASEIKCGHLRQDFIECVMQYSECVKLPGTTFQECLRPPHVFPEECGGLRSALYQCKRSLVDRRSRLRGEYSKKLGL